MKRHLCFAIAGLAALLLWTCFYPTYAQNALMKPPPNCATMRIGNTEYVEGEVFLSAHSDTVALKPFGFRNFKFVGHSVSSVKYAANWPKATDLKALPQQVSGLNYEILPGTENSNSYNSSNSSYPVSQSSYSSNRCSSSSCRTVSSCSNIAATEFWEDLVSPPSPLKKNRYTNDLERSTLGNFQVAPVDNGPFHRPESVTATYDPNIGTFFLETTNYYFRAADNYPYCRKSSDYFPYTSGSCVNRFSTARSHTTLSPSTFRATSQTFFVVPEKNRDSNLRFISPEQRQREQDWRHRR
jgi:hypothetical protein